MPWDSGTDGQEPASLSLRQPTSVSGRELHSEREARAHHLGRSENPRAPDSQVLRYSDPGQKHHPCGAASSRRPPSRRPQVSFNSRPRFDKFIDIFNNERPHEALDMQCPAEVYQPSPRVYTGLPDIDYPLHDKTIVVTRCGCICLGKKKINFSTVFAGQAVGIKEVYDDIWLVSFMDYDLGYFDLETRVLEPLENPFGPKVLPMS